MSAKSWHWPKFEMFNVIKDGETSFLVCVPQILIGLSKRSVNAKIEKNM